MVSHDLHLVMASTDEVVCLNQHVCCAGTPESVSRHPEYFAMFGPTIAPSLAVYTHAHDHAHDAAGHLLSLDGKPLEEHGHDHPHHPHHPHHDHADGHGHSHG
jgi:zinc transport system ATP-binding protein